MMRFQRMFLLAVLGAIIPITPAQAAKPWLDDPAAFLSDRAAQHWIIGRSTGPCLSETEATQHACRDAAQQIAPSLQAYLPPRSFGPSDWEWASRRLRDDLVAGRFVRDRSISRTHKPYGDLWSAAILVDASPGQLRSIASEYSNMLGARHASFARQLMSIVGLCMAILLVYALLNAATKGYFRGRLRTGAAVSLLLLLLLMARIMM